jgi:hypothetical protein
MFPFYKKIFLLPEIPQMPPAQEITDKLFLPLQSKIGKPTNIKDSKILNEDRCLNTITTCLRCLNKVKTIELNWNIAFLTTLIKLSTYIILHQ